MRITTLLARLVTVSGIMLAIVTAVVAFLADAPMALVVTGLGLASSVYGHMVQRSASPRSETGQTHQLVGATSR